MTNSNNTIEKIIQSLNKHEIYIIFFSTPNIISKCIKLYEWCWCENPRFSHVGITFHTDILNEEYKIKNCNPSGFVVLESTLSGPMNDNINNTCNKVKFGVQIRSLKKILLEYRKNDAQIAVSKIKYNIPKEKFHDVFNKSLGKVCSKTYDYDLYNLLTIHTLLPSIQNGRMFCSETVYTILISLDVKVKKKNAKKVSPDELLKYVEEPIFLLYN